MSIDIKDIGLGVIKKRGEESKLNIKCRKIIYLVDLDSDEDKDTRIDLIDIGIGY